MVSGQAVIKFSPYEIARGRVADLTVGAGIEEQFRSGRLESKFVWDTNGCFGEAIFNSSDVIYQQSYCKGTV